MFKQNQVVRVKQRYRDILRGEGLKDHPLASKELARVLYLGEIPNMPGHCIIVTTSGDVMWGFHTEDFEEIPEDEV